MSVIKLSIANVGHTATHVNKIKDINQSIVISEVITYFLQSKSVSCNIYMSLIFVP